MQDLLTFINALIALIITFVVAIMIINSFGGPGNPDACNKLIAKIAEIARIIFGPSDS